MITDLVLIEAINKSLADRFRVLDGRPIYRLVWSGDQQEVRRGLMREFYGQIFLREYFTVGPRPKYWYFQKPCWLLEKLVFIRSQEALKEVVKELVECANGSYEPIFPFVDKDFNPLPVSSSVVEIVIWKLQNPTVPITPGQMKDLEEKLEAAEMRYFEEELAAESENKRSPLFTTGDSLAVSTNQLAFNRTYKQEYQEK